LVYLLSLVLSACSSAPAEPALSVLVQSQGQSIVDAEVTLWEALPDRPAREVAHGTTDHDGKATLISPVTTGVRYVIARGSGVSKFEALAVLGSEIGDQVVLNELTTIGSIWPNAQQFEGRSMLGSKNGLLIGSEQVANLVNVSTGELGATVLNGANLSDSETVGRIHTLAALMALCGAEIERDSCDAFLNAIGSGTTLEALQIIARAPYEHASELFDLFERAYPFAKGEQRRPTSFLPYLSYEPRDFALMVRFTGGGIYSPGRLMFDDRGQLWSGQNWMPGSQSGLIHAIGGGVVRMAPGGAVLSPAPQGLNSQGVDGVGWGTTVSQDKVWVSSFNGVVGVFDLDGTPLGPAKVDGKNGALQGLATAPNGDVWVCDNQMSQMIVFPNGDHTKGRVVQVPGLKRPFAVAVDNQNTVWVTNNGFITATRFPADAPEKAQQIRLGGMAPRGLAIDSTGHVWVGNNFSLGYPLAKVPDGASIIEEFKVNIEKVLQNEADGLNTTGNLTLISTDGEVMQTTLDGEVYAPWGVTIDGHDNVFAGNFLGTGFMHVCGTNEDHCPPEAKTGDLIHLYQSGVLQESTDTMVDDAGNVWMANNWNVIHALVDDDPDRRTSTMGGGQGMVVIYGLAKPVVNPLIGQVRPVR